MYKIRIKKHNNLPNSQRLDFGSPAGPDKRGV